MQDFRMETFLMVCKCMNFTRAAQELGLTQPAVSQQIHYLEKEYQVALFQLEGRRVQLTEAGRMLKSAALTIKHDEIYLRNRMQRAAEKKTDYIFGATLTAAEYILPPQLIQFRETHPHSRLHVCVANTEELLRKIDEGELDFAVVEGYFAKDEYDSFLFSKESYLPVGMDCKANAFAGKELEDLLEETLITREKGSGTREVLEKILAEHNITVNDFKGLIEIGNINIIKQLASAGCGITFLYRAAVQGEIEEGKLAPLLLNGWKQSHELRFVFRKGSIFKEEYQKIFGEICNSEYGAVL